MVPLATGYDLYYIIYCLNFQSVNTMLFSLLKDFLTNLVREVGYLGVFIAMTVESCLIPLPSEITMPVAGFLASEGVMNLHIASLMGAIGNVLGSWMAYWLGMRVKEEALLKFIRKWGKFLLLSEHEYLKVQKWIQKRGSFVSFFSRLLPGIRTVVSLPAGVARIPFWPFTIWTFLGSLLWSYILVIVGYLLEERWANVEPFFHKFELAIIAAGLLFIAWWVWRHFKR